MNVTRTAALILVAAALAGCAESQPYPVDYRLAETGGGHVWIIGADMADVCEAIADRTCDGEADGCTERVLERCIPAGGGRIEYASAEAYHRDWWACLDAIGESPRPRWGTTRPPACVPLTPFWKAIPVTVSFPRLAKPPAAPAPTMPTLELWCVPTADMCPVGDTCRMLGAHDGRCRTAGPFPAGTICTSSAECGYAMHCAQASDGHDRCGVICDVAYPSRCTGPEVCLPYVSDDVGLCTVTM